MASFGILGLILEGQEDQGEAKEPGGPPSFFTSPCCSWPSFWLFAGAYKAISRLSKKVFGVFWWSFGNAFGGISEMVLGIIKAKALVMLASSGA